MTRVIDCILKILLISVIILTFDGGQSILTSGSHLNIHLTESHVYDLEASHQHQQPGLLEDEMWSGQISPDFSLCKNGIYKFLFSLNCIKPEFFNTIWQPPKESA
jgi:hypothetical protein